MGGNFDWAGVGQGLGSAGQHYMGARVRREDKAEREAEKLDIKTREGNRIRLDVARQNLADARERFARGRRTPAEVADWDKANEDYDSAVSAATGQTYSRARRAAPGAPITTPGPSPSEPAVAGVQAGPRTVVSERTDLGGDFQSAVPAQPAPTAPAPTTPASTGTGPAAAPAAEGRYAPPPKDIVTFGDFARLNKIQVPPEILAEHEHQDVQEVLRLYPQFQPVTDTSVRSAMAEAQTRINAATTPVERALALQQAKLIADQIRQRAPQHAGLIPDFDKIAQDFAAERDRMVAEKAAAEGEKVWRIEMRDATTKLQASLGSPHLAQLQQAIANYNNYIAAGKGAGFIKAGAADPQQLIMRWAREQTTENSLNMLVNMGIQLTPHQRQLYDTFHKIKTKRAAPKAAGKGKGKPKGETVGNPL